MLAQSMKHQSNTCLEQRRATMSDSPRSAELNMRNESDEEDDIGDEVRSNVSDDLMGDDSTDLQSVAMTTTRGQRDCSPSPFTRLHQPSISSTGIRFDIGLGLSSVIDMASTQRHYLHSNTTQGDQY